MTMTRVGSEFLLGSSATFKLPTFPDVAALTDSGAVVVFNEMQIFGPDADTDGAVYFNLLDDTGAFSGTAVRVNESTSGAQGNAEVHALANGNFVVTWTSDFRHDSGEYDRDAFLRLYDSSGTALTGEIDITPDDTPSSSSSDDEFLHDVIANADGSFSVFYDNNEWNNGWQTLVQQDFTAAGAKTGVPLKVVSDIVFTPDVIRLTNGDLIFSGIGPQWVRRDIYSSVQEGGSYNTYDGPARAAALTGGGFVLFYDTQATVADEDERLRYEVRDNDGNLVFGDEFFWTQVVPNGLRPQAFDVMALSSGGFVLTWMEEDSDGTGIFARAYNADGSANGEAVQINAVETGDQTYPEMSELANGNVMFVWQDASGNPYNGVDETARGTVFTVPAGDGGGDGGDGGDGGTDPEPTGPNLVEGTNSAETLTGTAGDDILRGLGGNDTLEGLGGNNEIDGGNGFDRVSYENASSGVRVLLHKELAIRDDGRDTLISIEYVTGSAFNDVVVTHEGGDFRLGEGYNIFRSKAAELQSVYVSAGDGGNKIIGGLSYDSFIGGDGDDLFRGGAASDSGNMGGGNDVARMGADADSVNGQAGDDRLFGNGGNDNVYGGDGNDRVYGGSGADYVFGDAGDDAVRGDSGQDKISGGLGDDNLYGGANRDQFLFSDLDYGGQDRIKDFEDGLDLLNFSNNALGWEDFDDVLAAASNAGTLHMKIDFGNGDQVVIENFRLADFDATDVSFDLPT